jgi:hypothetical protein
MQEGHGVSVEQAEEALADERRVVFEPDYASRSGQSVRVIGYSTSADKVLTVIVVTDENGKEWGGSGWPANKRDKSYYEVGGESDEQDQ